MIDDGSPLNINKIACSSARRSAPPQAQSRARHLLSQEGALPLFFGQPGIFKAAIHMVVMMGLVVLDTS